MAERIYIDTDQIVRIAQILSRILEEMEGNIRNVEGFIDKSTSYWGGQASGQNQTAWEQVENQVQESLGKLKEQPVRLLKSAGLGEELLEKGIEKITALPTENIC